MCIMFHVYVHITFDVYVITKLRIRQNEFPTYSFFCVPYVVTPYVNTPYVEHYTQNSTQGVSRRLQNYFTYSAIRSYTLRRIRSTQNTLRRILRRVFHVGCKIISRIVPIRSYTIRSAAYVKNPTQNYFDVYVKSFTYTSK